MRITLPYSKSIMLRALALKYVYGGEIPEISAMPDDVACFADALGKLQENREGANIYIGDGAAPLRFLTAIVAASPGCWATITPSSQLGRRPHEGLFDALRELGAEIIPEYSEWKGRGILKKVNVKGRKLKGGEVKVDASLSSQYASALLLASPLMERSVKLILPGEGTVSRPYLDMTVKMLEEAARGRDPLTLAERDWSSASYFYEWALLHPEVELELNGLTPPGLSLQGDSACAGIFGETGVDTDFGFSQEYLLIKGNSARIEKMRKTGLRRDCTHTPDLVPALVCAMCGAGIPFELTGTGALRHKETDRGAVLKEELKKAGFTLDVSEGILSGDSRGGDSLGSVAYSSHGDHRIAMSLYPLMRTGDTMDHPEAVSKSFPDFYKEIRNCNRLTDGNMN
ncbi:MAG: hypothetical protein NC328_08705 [Muribaculum sp.]|nr:hypothetical protein [Muribaculum sp.]